MQSKRLLRGLVASLALAALAGPTLAAAVVEDAPAITVKNNRKVTIVVPVTMSGNGTVTLMGELAGVEFTDTKNFKTKKEKTKNVKFKVDAKKLGIADATDLLPLLFTIEAVEEGDPAPALTGGGSLIPPPLIIVPGLANELNKGAYDPFAKGLNEAAAALLGQSGEAWHSKGKGKLIFVHHYKSLSFSLEKLGSQLAKKGQKTLKRSVFAKLDIVSQSTGGLVARQAMAPLVTGKKQFSLAGQVRNLIMMGTPNSGVPIAELARRAVVSGDTSAATTLLGQIDPNPALGDLSGLLLVPEFLHVVELFLPTFDCFRVPLPGGVPPEGTVIDLATLSEGATVAPLLALNAFDPDPATAYTGIIYMSTPAQFVVGDVQTAEIVDLRTFIVGGGTDLTTVLLENGAGDGVVTRVSHGMAAHPNWASRITVHELPEGLHNPAEGVAAPSYYTDPDVGGILLATLLTPTVP